MDETSICNQALGRIGSNRITSLDEASQPARFCQMFYAQTREEVIQSHPWSFAIARKTLSRLAEAPAFGWDYQYQLPSDYLGMIQLNDWEPNEARDLYEIEGGKLLTDVDAAELRYIARITDSNLFSPAFVEALAVKLASKLITPLAGSPSQAQNLLAEYEKITAPVAAQANAREGRSKRKLPWVESDLVRSRYGV